MVLDHRSPITDPPKAEILCVVWPWTQPSSTSRCDLPILPTTPLLPLVKIQQHRRPDIDNNIYSFTKDATARHRRHDANVFINSNSRGYIIMKQNTFDKRWFVGLIRCWSLGLFALFSIDACFQFWSKRYFMLLTAFFLPPTEQIESESLSKNHLVHAINCITLEFTWIRSEWNSLPSHASFHSWNYHVDFAECAVVGWIADELHRILSPTKIIVSPP